MEAAREVVVDGDNPEEEPGDARERPAVVRPMYVCMYVYIYIYIYMCICYYIYRERERLYYITLYYVILCYIML